MPATHSVRFRKLVAEGDLQGLEELWLERLEAAPADIDSFMAGVDALESVGNFDRAALLLGTLTSTLLERQLFAEALVGLRATARIAPRERGLRHGLITTYRSLHKDHPWLETYLEQSGLLEGKDLKEAVEKLERFLGFRKGRYVFHPAGWGAGIVVDVDPDTVMVVVDFEERKGHRISMEMASKVTEFVEDTDLRAYRFDRLEMLLQLVEDDPVEVLRAALRSRRGKGTLREMRDRLTSGEPPVIPAKAWSRWWQKTRQRIKASGEGASITMTPGSNPALELGEETRSYAQACLRDLRMLDGDAKQVRYLRDLVKEAENHDDGEEAVAGLAGALAGVQSDGSDLSLGPRISLAFVLREASQRYASVPHPDALKPDRVINDIEATIQALPNIPVSGHRIQALEVLRAKAGEAWPDLFERVVLVGEPDSTDSALASLVRHGHQNRAAAIVRVFLDRYRENPASFLWYAKAVAAGRISDKLPKEGIPAILEKALILHSHLDVATSKAPADDPLRKVAKSLANMFQARDFAIVRQAFHESTTSEGRSLANMLRNNRSLNADQRDKMLAVMFRVRPELGKREKSDQPSPEVDPTVVYTTERALLKKRMDYEDLVNRQIPDNAQEIGRAASYGDLSENAEWSAAVEKQARLTRESEELGESIGRARIIDRSIQDGVHITLGSRVLIANSDGQRKSFTILGPWDVDADTGVISYESPLGRALLGKKVGDTIEVQVRAGIATYKVEDLTDGFPG